MAPVKRDRLGEILRQGADGLREQAVFRPFGKYGQTGDNGVDERLGCGNCLFRSRLDVDGVIGCVSKGGGQGVHEGEGKRSALAGTFRQRDDVRAFARLRYGEGCRPFQPQFRLVDRGERRAERGDWKPRL